MTADDARKIAAVLATADGGCYVCAGYLADEMAKVYPEHDWKTLVEEALKA